MARFYNKIIFLWCKKKRSGLLQRWRCSCKFKTRRIGSCFLRTFRPEWVTSTPGANPKTSKLKTPTLR
jgi:hypothetical protein